ncbi:MAG TPA: GNAT family N-acetyltransferase [Polyangiales bacterium]|nr:GNAT family N-acetyltransferase [Polyangiales bacterium]
MSVEVEPVSGAQIEPYLDALAALRIEVFREYPYLYDGTLDYERRYLRGYAASPRSVVVLARDGEAVVGAATAMPLRDHGEDVVPALEAAGFDPARVYYFGESVLRASYRGRGIGHAFFDHREAAARRHGFSIATFCAVQRPPDHPRKPAGYVSHDAFWRKRGFEPRPDIVASFEWQDLDESSESPKPMLFWVKELAP